MERKMNNVIYKRFCNHKWKLFSLSRNTSMKCIGKKLCTILITSFLFANVVITCCCLNISFRNMVFSSVMPSLWRPLTGQEIYKIYSKSGLWDVGTCPEKCSKFIYPKITRDEVMKQKGIFHFYRDSGDLTNTDLAHFLPSLSRAEKIDMLHTLQALTQIFDDNGIKYFLADGTLLGHIRHKGMIPWDDDIDIGVDSNNWRKTKEILCCVQGFQLVPNNNMHWKFFSKDGMTIPIAPAIRFPFVDLFLYQEDEEMIWSITRYNLKNLAFKKTDVFPLSKGIFEGTYYPIPKNSLHLVNLQFKNISECRSNSMYHKYNHALKFKEVVSVPCVKLKILYNISNV